MYVALVPANQVSTSFLVMTCDTLEDSQKFNPILVPFYHCLETHKPLTYYSRRYRRCPCTFVTARVSLGFWTGYVHSFSAARNFPEPQT
jgi:hypothetical protein